MPSPVSTGPHWETPSRLDGLEPQRVAFSLDATDALAQEWERRGRPVTFAVGTNAARVRTIAGVVAAAVWTDAVMHVPRAAADEALQAARASGAELVVAVGGGSAIGFAKWIAHHDGLPIVAVPTTLAGSEATASFGVTEDGRKRVTHDPRVLPRVVIYDPKLVATMPNDLRTESALNALAHSVDALWAPATSEAVIAEALGAINDLATVQRQDSTEPGSLDALQRGTYRASAVFSAAGSGLHHKICHVLGGTFGLPHAPTHAAVVGPFALRASARDQHLGERLAAALGGSSLLDALEDVHAGPRSNRTLAELGLSADDVVAAAEIVASAIPERWSGLRERDDIEDIIRAAWAGSVPAADSPRGAISAAQSRVEDDVVERVLRSFADTPDKRLREVMTSLVRHLHAFARDVRLTESEWEEGIGFLTRAGHITDARRQEFVLLSDVLGLSMQVIAINNEAYADATEATVFGPFFTDEAPKIEHGGDIAFGAPGEPCWVEGVVRDTDGKPVEGARIDVWEADDEGLYDVQREGQTNSGRGWLESSVDGSYAFWGLTPTPYPIPHDGPVGGLLAASSRSPMRASHLHFMVTASGLRRLVTHIFVEGDNYLASDSVFGVKDSLVKTFERHAATDPTPDGRLMTGTWSRVRFDIVLAPKAT